MDERSIFLPQRDSKYGAHVGSCGLASALILICRCIGVSDSRSKMNSRRFPSSGFSVAANVQVRVTRVLKCFSLTHGEPLPGCRLTRYPAPCGASLHCQDRSLFRSLDSPGDTGGSLLSFIVGTTSTSDFVSHLIFLFFARMRQEQRRPWRPSAALGRLAWGT